MGFKCSPIGPALWDKWHQNICTHHWNAITLEKESSSYTEVWNNHRQHIKIGNHSSVSSWNQQRTKAKPSHTPSSKKVGLCNRLWLLESFSADNKSINKVLLWESISAQFKAHPTQGNSQTAKASVSKYLRHVFIFLKRDAFLAWTGRGLQVWVDKR